VRDSPITTTLLLNSLKDERNDAAWGDFDSRYRRLIEDFARSAGLRDEEAMEVAQQTLVDFVKAYRQGRYSREKGRLHSWIIGIAQNKVTDVFRYRGRAAIGGSVVAEQLADDASSSVAGPCGACQGTTFDITDSERVSQVWEQHVQQAIFREAMEKLRTQTQLDEATIKAFELVSVRGVSVEAAARECGMKAGEIYVAKHRVLTKLRKIVEEITAAWES